MPTSTTSRTVEYNQGPCPQSGVCQGKDLAGSFLTFADQDVNTNLQWRIISQEVGQRSAGTGSLRTSTQTNFGIDALTGTLRINAQSEPQSELRDIQNFFRLRIEVSDQSSGGVPGRRRSGDSSWTTSNTAQVSVYIKLEEGNTFPRFLDLSGPIVVDEDESDFSRVLAQFRAADDDDGDTVTFTILPQGNGNLTLNNAK